MKKQDIILKTSLELLVKQGIQETPISQISKESGIAVGTIYHHFSGKTDIINTIFVNLKQEYAEILIVGIEDKVFKKKYAKEVFEIIWRNIYNYYINNEDKFRFLVQIGPLPIITPESAQEGIKGYDPALKQIKWAMKNKIYRSISVRLATEIVHSSIVTLVLLSLQGSIKVTPKVLTQTIEMSWDSIAYKKTEK